MTTDRIDLAVEYLGGIAAPTVDDVGKIAVVALDALGRPNFQYLTQTASVADDTFATTLAPHLRGIGLTVDSSGNLMTRIRPRRPGKQDHFLGGGLTSGLIGELGWNLNGSGTPAVTRASSNMNTASKLSLTTSASANNRSSLTLGETESRLVMLTSEFNTLQMNWNMNASLATKRAFFGLSSAFATEPQTVAECVGVYYDSAVSANYQIIARTGSVGSPVDTGVAVPSNTSELITFYQPTAGTIQVYVGNTLIGTLTTNIPAGNLNCGWRVETLAASAATIRVGHWSINAVLVGSLDDDTFLEA